MSQPPTQKQIFQQIKSSDSTANCCHFIITGLQDTTLALDFRVTALEENGGGDGNSSVAELEVRVETLEGTAADHETRISATESDLTGRYYIIHWTFRLTCNVIVTCY